MVTLGLHDPALFNLPAFAASLAGNDTPLAAFKQALGQGQNYIKRRFTLGASVKALVYQRAWLTDQLLIQAWRMLGLPERGAALVAVGGYGRGELHPNSDIDIAILVAAEIDPELKKRIGAYIAFLWDIGLEVGHSVRTVAQCQEAAVDDVTVATNLIEARWLLGEQALFAAMVEATGPAHIWPSPRFFEAKVKEQDSRYRKYHDTAHNLEPNIKESPGGLRDIQMIGWVAKRHFGVATLHELVGHGFLTEAEYNLLDSCQTLLWRIRFVLHNLTGRREDRLLFDYQRSVARQFGFDDNQSAQLGVERFMKLYYRTVMELGRLNEMLIQLFQEAILEQGHPAEIRPLNKRFQIRNDYIEVCDENVFKNYPFALLEVFLLLQQNPEVKGVRASTVRLIRDHRYLIDEPFRNDIKTRSLFLEIIRQPRRLGHELQRMHRYGVLAAYLPVFGAVEGLMQFDLFHVYTVDIHTLFVVQNMRRFSNPHSKEALPTCYRLMTQLPKPEILYLSGLFHDLAKGRGVDHSQLGSKFATDFCFQLGLSQYDSKLVSWLVKCHLLMSTTATRKDISDPLTINAFARLVGNRVRLDYLYLLTAADIQATSPKLWNPWKEALLNSLYDSTLRALRRGVGNPIDKAEWIAETKGEALAMLFNTEVKKDDIVATWRELGDDYFLRYWPDEILWHTQAIASAKAEDLPLILLREQTLRGGTEIFVYAPDQDHIFAATTRTLDQLGLTILDARIITAGNGYTLDTYIVLEANSNEPVSSKERAEEIVETLRLHLARKDIPQLPVNRYMPRQLKQFTLQTEVSFTDDAANNRTSMEVVAADRPGILSRIAYAMKSCGVRLQNAKIATFGERVEDIFYITDKDNQPIHYPQTLECLRREIIEALSPPQNGA
jgi:[protein-PII] uridylyltransferase